MKEGHPGANKFTNMMIDMSKKVSDKPLSLDFGLINGDLSLTTNTFPKPIPKGEYSICRSVAYDPSVPLTQTYTDGEHDHPGAGPPGVHQHNVRLPKKMYWLLPGDRVLVAWVQNEAVVIDKVYNGEHLGSGEPSW